MTYLIIIGRLYSSILIFATSYFKISLTQKYKSGTAIREFCTICNSLIFNVVKTIPRILCFVDNVLDVTSSKHYINMIIDCLDGHPVGNRITSGLATLPTQVLDSSTPLLTWKNHVILFLISISIILPTSCTTYQLSWSNVEKNFRLFYYEIKWRSRLGIWFPLHGSDFRTPAAYHFFH